MVETSTHVGERMADTQCCSLRSCQSLEVGVWRLGFCPQLCSWIAMWTLGRTLSLTVNQRWWSQALHRATSHATSPHSLRCPPRVFVASAVVCLSFLPRWSFYICWGDFIGSTQTENLKLTYLSGGGRNGGVSERIQSFRFAGWVSPRGLLYGMVPIANDAAWYTLKFAKGVDRVLGVLITK